MSSGTATVGNSMEMPQKMKNKTIICSRSPISGSISKGNKVIVLKRCLFDAGFCIVAMMGNSLSVCGWEDKENVIYCI